MTDAVMEFARRRRTLFVTLIPLVLWLFGRPTPQSLWGGLALLLIGQAIRLWSAGHISKDRAVATGGPYAWVRNPLYFGSLFISVGFAVIANTLWGYLLVLAQFLFFYMLAILSEERYLKAHLGEEYAAYTAAVPRFWPTRGRYAKAEGRFSWGQVAYNKEYRSYVPIALLFLLFALKAYGVFDPLAALHLAGAAR